MTPARRRDVTAQLATHVVFRRIDADEGCLLDLRQKRFYGVNAAGARLLTTLSRGATEAMLVADLARHFARPPSACRREVAAFLKTLRAAGLLDGGSGRRRPREDRHRRHVR